MLVFLGIQLEKMPDCFILNPKMHPDPRYQELCGCGITFVLLRQLGQHFSIPDTLWKDLLAITGMATICDVVPLNSVNHKLAKMGIEALMKSRRPVLLSLRQACSQGNSLDEMDIGFRLGPRINAVGRLEHAHLIIDAFINENPDPLVQYMEECNERRKKLQSIVVNEAMQEAENYPDSPILFLGGDWHPGVVGIAASKLAEKFWRPVWLFQEKDGVCKGSARSIPGFDLTAAMSTTSQSFNKFGGHEAAAGYTFNSNQEYHIREALHDHAEKIRQKTPQLWESSLKYDCTLPLELLDMKLCNSISPLKPFGHSFEEPKFCIEAEIAQVQFYLDKCTKEPKHTAVFITNSQGERQKILFFNAVHKELNCLKKARFIVSASKNHFRGKTSLSLMGSDYQLS